MEQVLANQHQARSKTMKIIKRILAILGIFFGIIGMVLCLAVIIGAWWINDPITDGLLKIFPPIEAALLFGDSTAEQFAQFIGETNGRFDEATEVQPLAAALANEVEHISLYVDVASGLADAVAETISGVASSIQGEDAKPVASLAADRLLGKLDEVNETLDSVESLAIDVSDGRFDKIDQLGEGLDQLEAKSAEVQEVIDQTSADVEEIKIKIPRWINLGSLTVTLVFIWFGIAQYLLFRSSWHWLRQPNQEQNG